MTRAGSASRQLRLIEALASQGVSDAVEYLNGRNALPTRVQPFLSILSDSLPHLLWLLDSSKACIYCNQRWLEYTGAGLDRARGQSWLDFVHSKDREPFEHAIRQRESFQVEHRLRRADGTYRWFLSRAVPVRSPNGQVLVTIGTSTDVEYLLGARPLEPSPDNESELISGISERMAMESYATTPTVDSSAATLAQVHIAEQPGAQQPGAQQPGTEHAAAESADVTAEPEPRMLARLVHDAAVFVSVHVGPRHDVEGGSSVFERLLARPFNARGLADAFGPELLSEGLQERLDRVFHTGQLSIIPEVRWPLSHHELYVNEVIQPWVSSDGRQRGVTLIGVDVTAHVRARDNLLASEERLNTIVERAPVGIALVSGALTWQRLNGELCTILGVSRGELLGREIASIFKPADWPEVHTSMLRVQTGQRAYESAERSLVTRDGRIVWCSVTVAPLSDSRSVSRQLVAIVEDVGERHEYQLRLEDYARHTDAFLAMLGHELRNPLAAIANASGLMEQVDLRHDPVLTKVSHVLMRQTQQMRRLVDDLLDVHRIGEGKISLHCTTLDLVELVRSVAEDQAPQFVAKGLPLALEIGSRRLWVRGDRVRLAQILQNLLSNAAKFTETGGQVRVCVERQAPEPDDGANPGFVLLSVKDTGIGMDGETLRTAFDPFRQADRTLERSRGGLGLGLTLVRSLVALHGGEIFAQSQGLGTGSTITMRLKESAPPSEIPPQRAEGSGKRLSRVLVVEDNVDSADTLKALLELAGYEVQVAKNAVGALEKMAAFSPELVVCDIGLPGLSGFDLAQRLRAAHGPSLKLIALTGYGGDADRRRSAAAGFDFHMTKPLDMELFEKVVATWSPG